MDAAFLEKKNLDGLFLLRIRFRGYSIVIKYAHYLNFSLGNIEFKIYMETEVFPC